jgi:PAS domain S-box-containing protein
MTHEAAPIGLGEVKEPVKSRTASRLPMARLIALFLVLSAVPVALLTWLSVRVASDALRDEAEARVSSTASATATAVESELHGLLDLVESYAGRPTLREALSDPNDFDLTQIRYHLNELKQSRPGIATAFVADPSGILIDIVPSTPSIVGNDFSFRDWYKGVSSTGRPYVSEAYESQAAGHPRVVAGTVFVRDAEGKPLAILVAAYALQTIQGFVDEFADSQNVDLTVTDHRGTQVAAPGAPPAGLVSRRDDPLVKQAVRGSNGEVHRESAGGRVLSSYQPVPTFGWTVTADVPEGEALAAIGKVRATVLAIAGVMGLALAGGLLLLVLSLRSRRRAEEAGAHLGAIVSSSDDAIIGKSLDGTILSWNLGARRLYGYRQEEAVGQSISILVPPGRADEVPEILERIPQGEPVKHFETIRVRKDGTPIDVSLTVSPIRNSRGEVVGASTVARDITEERAAQEALRQREATLHAVFAASPDVITMIGPNLDLGPPTPAVYGILGYDPEEYATMDRLALVHPDDRERVIKMLEGVLGGGSPAQIRYRVRHADGHWVILETRAQGMTDGEGHPMGAVAVSRDVSEHVALEDALWQAKEEADTARDDAERAKDQAERAKDQAEQANRAKSEFLSRMSHELRTPLNSVLGFGELLEMDDLDADQRESVRHIMKGGRHLLDLINEVLDIARIESGRMALSLEPVSVREVVEETVELVRPLAAEAGIRLVSEPIDGHTFVLADRQRLKQVLLNLLSNAVKFNRPEGSVTVRYEDSPEDRLRISVTDEGPGIAPELAHRLFVPFERLGADRDGIQGTGLGLALSRGLAEAMGGTISLESTPGIGSMFAVELLRAEAEAFYQDVDDFSAAEAVSSGRPSTLLYVEDNSANFKLIERALTHRPNVRLLGAIQGSLGLELARQHQPDVVLLDLNLPDIPGDEVLRLLRADPRTAEIPVVVLSADATPGQIRKLMAAGAVDYLTKPLEVRRFLETLDKILAERSLGHAG